MMTLMFVMMGVPFRLVVIVEKGPIPFDNMPWHPPIVVDHCRHCPDECTCLPISNVGVANRRMSMAPDLVDPELSDPELSDPDDVPKE